MKYKNIINALAVCGKADLCTEQDCPFYKDDESKEDGICQRELMKSALKKLGKLHEENKQLKAIANAYENALCDEQERNDELTYTIDELHCELDKEGIL